MTRRTAAQNALKRLWNLPLEESEDEVTDNEEEEDQENVSDEVDVNCGSESSNESDESISDSRGDSSSESSSEENESEMNHENKWKILSVVTNNTHIAGRTTASNVFKEAVGIKAAAARKIRHEFDAFSLFIEESILQKIFTFTKRHAETENSTAFLRRFSFDSLQLFLALELARGVYGKKHSVKLLWSETFGLHLFSNTMSRDHFVDIKRHLRFDEKQTRSFRLTEDPFTHIREVFNDVISNCRKHFVPNFSVCIDEQLMPLKCRCKFIVFMPNKPDKFGLKFWFLVDNETKYIYNVLPYLGAVEKDERQGLKLADFVVRRLISPLAKKAYNVTCDNFFTSVELAQYLLAQNTTMVGTLRQNSKNIPSYFHEKQLAFSETMFCYSPKTQTLLLKYQCKKKKSVMLLSTMHCHPHVDETEVKKPLVIHYYNINKCGVDTADAMLREYTTRSATRRWPVAVWHNLLDISILNAWVCFRQATGSKIPRKNFILNVIQHLISSARTQLARISGTSVDLPLATLKRKKCRCGSY
jgi:hypothetical protein